MSQLPAVIPREKARAVGAESAPVVRIQKMLFEEAAAADASDVHIEPGQTVTRVRYRINGVLNESLEIPKWLHENLVFASRFSRDSISASGEFHKMDTLPPKTGKSDLRDLDASDTMGRKDRDSLADGGPALT